MGGQHHAPAASPPGKTRYPLYRRLGGPQGWSGRVRKISPHTGIRSPDRPARSESLYRLSYPGRLLACLAFISIGVFSRASTINGISFLPSQTCDFGINNTSFITGPFLGAFEQFPKAAVSFIVSVSSFFRPRGITRLPLGEFSLNFIFDDFFENLSRKFEFL